MPTWNSSPHPISDIRDWATLGRLELRPDFQRREVWSVAAKVMLIDTVLKNVPMPKILLNSVLREGNTYRIVIDGQQRLSAIIGFLRDEFKLAAPCSEQYRGMTFSALPTEDQNAILRYKVDLNEISEATDAELREIYSRVNKYNVSLNKQELRKADYPGDFLELSELLAQSQFFDKAGVFSLAAIRRYGDVEFTSELMAAVLNGPQDKKSSLDKYYEDLTVWDEDEQSQVKHAFAAVFSDLEMIFDVSLPISNTRFRQRSDIYSLFLAVHELRCEGFTIAGKPLEPLRDDLKILDYNAKPSSEFRAFSEYGVRCSTDANSESSRRWRIDFLKEILSGTYVGRPAKETGKRWSEILYQMADPLYCGPSWETADCGECEDMIGDAADFSLAWRQPSMIFQMSNAEWVHDHCIDSHPENWARLIPKEG